jgi:hypothetical protein
MKASEMKVGVWCNDMPEFDIECIFAAASLIGENYEYSIWEVKKLDGYDSNWNEAWYYGLLTGDGEEWGDINDFRADKYLIIPPHNK